MPVVLALAFGEALVALALAAGFDAAALTAGLAVVGLADVFAAAFGCSDFVALVFWDALFAGALASLERAAIAGPAPVFASRAFDFPVFFDAAGFFIAVPQVSVALIRNAIPPQKFRIGPIGA